MRVLLLFLVCLLSWGLLDAQRLISPSDDFPTLLQSNTNDTEIFILSGGIYQFNATVITSTNSTIIGSPDNQPILACTGQFSLIFTKASISITGATIMNCYRAVSINATILSFPSAFFSHITFTNNNETILAHNISNLIVQNCLFTQTIVPIRVIGFNSVGNVINSTFISNIGTCIDFDYGGTINISHSSFSFCNGGDAILVLTNGGISHVNNISITNSRSIYATIYTRLSSIHLSDSFFSSNYITNGEAAGGGLYNSQGYSMIDNCIFRNNTAGRGGAIGGIRPKVSIVKNTLFEDNVGSRGGAIWGPITSIVNCTFNNNVGYENGGAIYFYASIQRAKVENCTFINNWSVGNGGAIFGWWLNITLYHNCIFRNNTAVRGGGVIYSDMNEYTFFNNVQMIDNRAQKGSLIHGNGFGIFELQNVNISNNHVPLGSIFHFATLNTIFLYNKCKDSIMDNEVAGDIYPMVLENNNNNNLAMTIKDMLVPSNFSSTTLCCKNSSVPDYQLCSYPLCTPTCSNSVGCECPFKIKEEDQEKVKEGFQSLINVADTICDCLPGYYEPLCTSKRRPCTIDNGGCDYRSVCEQGYCGPCPYGYDNSTFDSSFCTPLCGNGVCEASESENCVTCPQDCKEASCGICGDGVCSSPENCITCAQDCSPCTSLPCEKGCYGNGACNGGICSCIGSWTGPYCNVSIVLVSISVNASNPKLEIRPSNFSDRQVTFSIVIRSLTERNTAGNVVYNQPMTSPAVNYTFKESSFFSNSSKNSTWEHSVYLFNHAMINITFIHFNSTTNHTFYNNTKSVPSNSIKLNILITNWPFKSIHNTLDLVIDVVAAANHTCLNSSSFLSDKLNHLSWVKSSLNGISSYVRFTEEANFDGRNKDIPFSFLNSNNISVYARLPHFYTRAELNPLTYDVSVEPIKEGYDKCGNLIPVPSDSPAKDDQNDKNNNKKDDEKEEQKRMIFIVSIASGGMAVLVGAIALVTYIYKRRTSPSK